MVLWPRCVGVDPSGMSRRKYMLQLRPNCECCNKDLPPHSTEALICSFECTFCRDCATQVLHGMCPNCGGNWCDDRFDRRTSSCSILQRQNGSSRQRVAPGLERVRRPKAVARHGFIPCILDL